MGDETSNLTPVAGTLLQVAQRAGVSKVTASMVLGRGGGGNNTRVSESTRQRIVQAAQELRYRPNALARTLRDRKTDIIGFYTGGYIDVRNNFLGEVISGLQQGCEQNRKDFLIHGTFRGDSLDDVYTELTNGKVDGLVILTNQQAGLIDRLTASHLPIVVMADPHPGLASVSVDDAGGSRMLAELLAEKGHRHVLYGRCPIELPSTARRVDAFTAAARELEIQVTMRQGRWNYGVISEAERAIAAWDGGSGRQERPTALVCWNDEMAHDAVCFLTEQGLRVPGDIAVAGFDGWELTIKPPYRLTTVRAPWRDAARLAVDLLVKNSGRSFEGDTVLPVELVAGDTV